MGVPPELETIERLFARRMIEVRESRSWSQTALAERLQELGVPIDRATLAKIERAANPDAKVKPRKVSLTEACQIAAALGVNPLALFIDPRQGDPLFPRFDEMRAVEVAPNLVLHESLYAGWFMGGTALRDDDDNVYVKERPTFDLHQLVAFQIDDETGEPIGDTESLERVAVSLATAHEGGTPAAGDGSMTAFGTFLTRTLWWYERWLSDTPTGGLSPEDRRRIEAPTRTLIRGVRKAIAALTKGEESA